MKYYKILMIPLIITLLGLVFIQSYIHSQIDFSLIYWPVLTCERVDDAGAIRSASFIIWQKVDDSIVYYKYPKGLKLITYYYDASNKTCHVDLVPLSALSHSDVVRYMKMLLM